MRKDSGSTTKRKAAEVLRHSLVAEVLRHSLVFPRPVHDVCTFPTPNVMSL